LVEFHHSGCVVVGNPRVAITIDGQCMGRS